MSYLVSARKYRPQTFADLIGQEITVRALQNAIRRNRISHACLFSGPRGVGKTTMARLLAKALNCSRGPAAEPCEQCDSCRGITIGTDMDVIEIDAASNRGIDDIRRLREGVQFAPVRDRFKIYIVDEAHQITTDAFNALLKTLEEPPDHVKFILATTEKHKLPITILSRCQQYDFQLLPLPVIAAQLKKILSIEKISYSDRSVGQIALAAEGSMRDALSLLDQVIAYCGPEAGDEEVENVLGVVDFALLERLTLALHDQQPGEVLQIVEEVYSAGFDLQVFCRHLLRHTRDLLIIKTTGAKARMLNTTELQCRQLEPLVRHFSLEDLLRFLELLGRVESEMKTAYFPRFSLELTLLKMTVLPRLDSLSEILAGLRSSSEAPWIVPSGEKTALPPPARVEPPVKIRTAESSRSSSSPSRGPFSPVIDLPRPEPPAFPPRNDPSAFLKRFGELHPIAVPWMSLASSVQEKEGVIRIRFPDNFRSVYDKLQEEACLRSLRQAAGEIYGAGIRVHMELETGGSSGPAATPSPKGNESELVSRIRKDPVLGPFLEHFPGEITEEKKNP